MTFRLGCSVGGIGEAGRARGCCTNGGFEGGFGRSMGTTAGAGDGSPRVTLSSTALDAASMSSTSTDAQGTDFIIRPAMSSITYRKTSLTLSLCAVAKVFSRVYCIGSTRNVMVSVFMYTPCLEVDESAKVLLTPERKGIRIMKTSLLRI